MEKMSRKKIVIPDEVAHRARREELGEMTCLLSSGHEEKGWKEVCFVMRKVKSHWPARDVHLTSRSVTGIR
jgi:hypothetical protein